MSIILFEALKSAFMANPTAQGIGLFALCLGLSAFAQKDDKRLKTILTIFTLIMGLHFLLMGSFAGAMSAWISTARTWIARKSRSVYWAMFFILLNLVIVLPRVDAWVYLLPIIGSCVGTWALFREKGIKMRLLMMCGTFCWLTHNFIIGSIGGTIIESSFLVMNSSTLIRMWRDNKKLLLQPKVLK